MGTILSYVHNTYVTTSMYARNDLLLKHVYLPSQVVKQVRERFVLYMLLLIKMIQELDYLECLVYDYGG